MPDGLVEAFWDYERALMSDDLVTLDRLFAPGPTTLRGDAQGLLVGHDQISAFRGSRGGAPKRRIVQTHVQTIDDDHALVVAVTELERGGRGQQTQLWARTADGWVVTAAHVAVPGPALDTRIWRVVGDPLVPAVGPTAPLDGESVAVKDLYAVAGHPVGAGNPAWLAEAPVEPVSAWVVQTLLDAGASVRGIARTDEFAYSLAGTNAHSGTPPNPKAPHRISGGSTSGSASAVSLGHATIGLGTDTGGSIRVPASYQGLFGIRTTHDVVPRDRLLAAVAELRRRRLADPVTPDCSPRSATCCCRLATSAARGDLVTVPGLTGLAEDDVIAVVDDLATEAGAMRETWDLSDLPDWLAAFQTLQAWEAWRERGSWLTTRLDTLGADVRGRFEAASLIDDDRAAVAGRAVAEARDRIRELVGDRILVLPSASSVAPRDRRGTPGRAGRDHVADLPRRDRRAAGRQHPAHHPHRPARRRLPGRRARTRPRPPRPCRRPRVKA